MTYDELIAASKASQYPDDMAAPPAPPVPEKVYAEGGSLGANPQDRWATVGGAGQIPGVNAGRETFHDKMRKRAPAGGFSTQAQFLQTARQVLTDQAREQGFDVADPKIQKSISDAMIQAQGKMSEYFTPPDELSKGLIKLPNGDLYNLHSKKVEVSGGQDSYDIAGVDEGGNVIRFNKNKGTLEPVPTPSGFKSYKDKPPADAGFFGSGRPGEGQATAAQAPAEESLPEGWNPDVLEGLSPAAKELIIKTAKYQIDPNRSTSLRRGERAQAIALAGQLNPKWNQGNFEVAQKGRQFFNTGAGGVALRAIGQVSDHLNTLKQAGEALKNTDIPAANAVKNEALVQTGDPRVVAFNQAREAVATEMAKVYRGGGVLSEKEMESWKKGFSVNASPAQIQQAISTAGKLLSGAITALDSQREKSLLPPDEFQVVDQKTADKYKALGVDLSQYVRQKPASAASLSKDEQALQWAKNNPNDPRSAAIIQKASSRLGK